MSNLTRDKIRQTKLYQKLEKDGTDLSWMNKPYFRIKWKWLTNPNASGTFRSYIQTKLSNIKSNGKKKAKYQDILNDLDK